MVTAALIEDLIEQNHARTQDILSQVTEATESITQIDQIVAELGDRLTSTGNDAQTHLDSFSSMLEQAEQQIETNLQEAIASLEQLTQQITESDAKADELAAEMAQRLDDFKSQVEEMSGDIDGESEEAIALLTQIIEQGDTMDAEVDAHHTDTQTYLDEFHAAIDQAKESFDQRKSDLIEQFEALETEVQSQLDALIDDVEVLKKAGQEKFEYFSTALKDNTDETTDLVNRTLHEDVSCQWSDSSAVLTHALEMLGELSDSSCDIFDGKLGDVLDTIGDVLDKIEPVLDVMERVHDVLG